MSVGVVVVMGIVVTVIVSVIVSVVVVVVVGMVMVVVVGMVVVVVVVTPVAVVVPVVMPMPMPMPVRAPAAGMRHRRPVPRRRIRDDHVLATRAAANSAHGLVPFPADRRSRSAQQILGNWSPTSMSTIRRPPKRVCITTRPGCSAVTRPIATASRP